MRLMIVDTVGGNRFTEEYKSLFPGVKIRGIEKSDDGPCHPHGYQVGYLAGCLLSLIPGEHELIFVRNFDGNARPVKGVNSWLLSVIKNERPHGINHSWGQWDADSVSGDKWGRMAWEDWAFKYTELLRDLNIASFSAAGNSDASGPSRPELDEDIDYPWKLIPFVNNIIGSHQRNGVPSYFSGDGKGLQCCFWADRIFAPMGNGEFAITSGTSFASPKALAVWSYYVQKPHLWRDFVQENCKFPPEYVGKRPHPKWGYGSLEHTFQRPYQELPIFALPSALNIDTTVEYFETSSLRI